MQSPDRRWLVLSLRFAIILSVAYGPTPSADARPPQEGECPSISALDDSGRGAEDAAPLILREGMLIDEEGLLALQSLLPKEIWRHREVFFFEGMLMEIGPCHRRYGIPRFHQDATRLHAGDVQLDEDGNLRGYKAGVPFPQDGIDPRDPKAGVKWAWNFQKRYRGAGYRGRFRITTFPSRAGGIERYRGSFFFFQIGGRADLATTDYRWPGAKKKLWAAGGEFVAPFNVRELAWRQFRSPKSERRWRDSDDVFVYVPSMRKMRRSGTPWIDGVFMPRYSIVDLGSGGSMAYGGSGGSVSPTAGRSAAVSEDARAGLTGLAIRPNAYEWRLRGELTVLAPLNSVNPGYPIEDERNYGPSGLSVANDRWDVRRAVVIEGLLRQQDDTIRVITLYVDYHTLQPLYWISRAAKRRVLDIGVFVHRYTGDVAGYPQWPNGIQAHAFEPVAASFFDALAGKGGWLRESYDINSLPYDEAERKRMVSADPLQRGR